MKAVGMFIARFLRGRNDGLEKLLDMVEFDIIVEKEVLRITSRDVRNHLLNIADSFPSFRKSSCCSGKRGNVPDQNASMKSLFQRMEDVSLPLDPDAMEIDLGGSIGPLDTSFL